MAVMLAGVALAPAANAAAPDQAPIVYLTPIDHGFSVSFNYFGTPNSESFEVSLNGGAYQAGLLIYDPSTNTGQGTIGGLDNARTYSVRIQAVNADGDGPPSDPVNVRPGVPDVLYPSATPDNEKANVTFGPPGTDGGSPVTGYDYSATKNDSVRNWKTATVNVDGSITVPNLANGTTFYIAVRARNANGSGAEGPSTTVVPGLPTAPSLNSATPGDVSAVLSFSPPAYTGGFAVDYYQVATLDVNAPDQTVRNWRKLPFTSDNNDPPTYTGMADGLTNGVTYNVYVRAHNATGFSPESGSQQVSPDAVPLAPTIDGVTTVPSDDPSVAGTGTVELTFTPNPGSRGTTTGFNVSEINGLAGGFCTTSPCQIPGLNNGTQYQFQLTASNNLGASDLSNKSQQITPIGAPYQPQDIRSAGADPRSATVSFVPPIFSGSPVVGYQLSKDGGATWADVATRTSGSRVLATADGLRSGVRYQVAVRAVNIVNGGRRPGVPTSSLTLLTGPTTVRQPIVSVGTAAALVQWPASTEPDVIGYTVYASSGGATCRVSARTVTRCIIGARAGVATNFRVVARSAVGFSYLSAPTRMIRASAPVVPKTAPGVPSGFYKRLGTVKSGKSATLSAPGFLPGSSVTLVAYGKKRYILRNVFAAANGQIRVTFRVPKDKAKSLKFVAFGVTPYASPKAIGTSAKRK